MKKYMFIALTMMFPPTPLAALAGGAQTHTYQVAVDAEYAPYEFRDVDGKVKGMLPDMLHAIGKAEGVSFEFMPMAWPEAVKSLENGHVDLINMIRTPERIGKYEFSEPHTIIKQALFRHINETEIHNVQTLTGHIVALQAYDIANEKLAGRNDFDRLTVTSKEQGFLALNTGGAAAFLAAEQPGMYFLKTHELKNVELAAVGLWPQDFCFTARKGNTAIIAMLNHGLAKLRGSDRYATIIRKWQVRSPNWVARHVYAIAGVTLLLGIMVLALWLWSFLLQRTVKQRTQVIVEEKICLRQSRERYRSLLQTMPGALLLIHDGMIAYANPAAMALFGIQDGEPEAGSRIPVTDLAPDRCVDFIQAQISEISSVKQPAPSVQGTLSRLDGSEFDAEVTAGPCEHQGNPGVQLIIQDISMRKQIEAEKNRLLSIIETSSDFIGMADAEGHILYINPVGRHMLGLTDDADVSDMQMADTHPPAEMERLRSEVLPQTAKHGGYQTEVIFLNQKGEEILTMATFNAQKNADGTASSYTVIARDIRVEREKQKKMEHIQRLESLGVLAGGIAHDFNNILTAILGNAAMAERKAVSHPEEMPKYIANIVSSSEKAAELCKQMLAYSGKGRFVVKPLNLSALTESIAKLLEVSIARNVVIKYQLADHLPAVDADAAQMQQIIMNLVINASDAIGKKSGIISIGTGVMLADFSYLKTTCLDEDIPEGRYVFLEISDTGCGMGKQIRECIFEPFFTTKLAGQGLGMSAVLGIIRSHRGAIKLYSEPGRGTTFKVLLPVSSQTPETIRRQNANKDTWHGEGAVLIVDDEETIRETAAMMLEDMGFTTMTAEDGVEGVETYRRHQQEITLVLLDMTMPKLDGKACFRELKRINSNVRVILSSGYNEQEATSHFSGKGLAGFIQKPYHPDALREMIRQAVD